ncbi:hypothetical protein GGR56DRAFT_212949 [Xylariaceae sp. FL0804]|nr:hypothetical protein GGR56DRAFT_212949 [Xylariaceae sp. FL0804]
MPSPNTAGHPTTGVPSTYEGQDQVNYSRSALHEENKHHTINAEGYMPKDRNRVMNQMRDEDIQRQIDDRRKHDPTYAATMHGHAPSKGAKMDADIQAEEAEILRKKQEKTDSLPGKK